MYRLLLLLTLFAFLHSSEACNCTEKPRGVKREFLNSSSVFIGRVVSVASVRKGNDSIGSTISSFRVVFELKKGYKNAWKKRIQVITNTEDECGVTFQKGIDYLVFAVGGIVLETDQCTRTRELIEADMDRFFLNSMLDNPETEETDEKPNRD